MTSSLAVQRRIQFEAGYGWLSCESHSRLLNQTSVSLIFATTLSAFGTAVCFAKRYSIKFPVLTTVCLLACTIKYIYDRAVLKKYAAYWRPIFEDILNARYKEALAPIAALWDKVEKAKGKTGTETK